MRPPYYYVDWLWQCGAVLVVFGTTSAIEGGRKSRQGGTPSRGQGHTCGVDYDSICRWPAQSSVIVIFAVLREFRRQIRISPGHTVSRWMGTNRLSA